MAKKTSMLADVSVEMETTSMNTFNSYVEALEKLFVIEDIEAWCPAIRSATVIRSGKKRCFVDPSIAVAAMGVSPKSLELDLKTFGFIYECTCLRDLKIYSQALGGSMSYYHDRYGLEAEAVLHLTANRFTPKQWSKLILAYLKNFFRRKQAKKSIFSKSCFSSWRNLG